MNVPSISVDTPRVPVSMVWTASEFGCSQQSPGDSVCGETNQHSLGLQLGVGTTSSHPLVRWAIELTSNAPLHITISGQAGEPVSWLARLGASGQGVDRVVTQQGCGAAASGPASYGSCDNLITGWSYETTADAEQTDASQPDAGVFDLDFGITWSDGYPTWTQQGAYLGVNMPGTQAIGYGIDPDNPPGTGPQISIETPATDLASPANSSVFVADDDLKRLPWKPYQPASVNLASFYDTDQGQGALNRYQIINGVPPDETPDTWAWLTQGTSTAAAVGQDPDASLHDQQILFWLGIALGVAGSAAVAAIQVFLGLRLEARHRGTADPLAVSAAVLAVGLVGCNLWLVHQQVLIATTGLRAILVAMCVAAALAGYGAFRRAPFRRTALTVALVVITLPGGLEALVVWKIGLLALADGLLLVVSLLRGRRRARAN